ncbi:hypothetical protein [Endozoicomonas sp.]|nr:hypothetical protein [Endozoicomonas sp.]
MKDLTPVSRRIILTAQPCPANTANDAMIVTYARRIDQISPG